MTTTEKLQALMALADDYADCWANLRSEEQRNACRAALRSALEPLVADAERYRWLRIEMGATILNTALDSWDFFGDVGAQVDSFVDEAGRLDAARSAEPQAEGKTRDA